ncbi:MULTISPECIES: helix-turn-helix domain-containing protein [Legionella]|uniref:DNA-binding protein n=1 Tax=Legionella drozanskii LLAP-1 TaxID=1212489 RepID=A0A0W0TDL7_9GAMM|nr:MULTISPECIES: helix-turn-helix domain-containing protein [Legionella]KTC93697.1 DNA-binding protein [Legionella drozanskii LLAP-1]PJE12723.1 MAG: DNA-binding protein [Legionella sp.]
MTTVIMDEIQNGTHEKPGLQLARVREKRGYSQEYVAGKLHLRVRIIELLEADDYDQMPEPVFIKGYFRAYAKLLNVPAEPLLEIFNSMYATERKLEKALWQSKRETHKGEHIVRVLTGIIAVTAIVAVGIWWQKNKDNPQVFSTKSSPIVAERTTQTETDIRLTDLSKMHSMLTPKNNNEMTPVETQGG